MTRGKFPLSSRFRGNPLLWLVGVVCSCAKSVRKIELACTYVDPPAYIPGTQTPLLYLSIQVGGRERWALPF